MTLHVAPFDRPLDGLADFLAAGPASATEAVAFAVEGGLEVVGPFPSYAMDPGAVVRGDWTSAEQVGWRALVRGGERPLTVVDLRETEEGLAYGDRNLDAAKAFADALDLAAQFAGAADQFAVRWLTLPGVYVTALWLAGEKPLFIPTRAGSAERPPAEILDSASFQAMIGQLVPSDIEEGLEARDEPDDVMPGSRSGPRDRGGPPPS